MLKKTPQELIRIVFIAISGTEALFFLFNNVEMREGLDDCIFLLPLTVMLCLLLFRNLIEYQKGGIALKIFYVVCACRYLVQPLLILNASGQTGYYMPSIKYSWSYYVAVFTMCVELLISSFIINKYYKRYCKDVTRDNKNYYKYPKRNISISGWMVIGFLAVILLVRINYVIPNMNIILFKDSTGDGVWYEAIIMNCIKAFFFVQIMQLVKNTWSGKSRILYYVVAVALAFLNFGMYFGTGRAYTAMTLIATIAIYFYVYPNNKAATMVFLVPVGIICIFTMFVNKQFGVEVGDFESSVITPVVLSDFVELYTGGPWQYASGFEAAFGRWLPDIGMIVAGAIQKFALVNIPGFQWLRNIEYACTSLYGGEVYAWDYYHTTLGIYGNSQILSGAMEILVSCGNIFGWFVAIAYHIWVTKKLVQYECNGKILEDIRYRYYNVWMGVAFGMQFCYSPMLLLWVWSKFALFYKLLLLANDRIHLSLGRIK